MALKVVGSGLGRTGTMSLKLALEQIGFGPCHHMLEVFMHPDSVPLWVQASQGANVWDAIFKDFTSAVDYPCAAYWRQLADHYPDAKILHSVRDPDRWFESTQETIFAAGGGALNPPPHMKAFFESLVSVFGDKIHDRAFMTDYFRRHTEEVKATIPASRLLVYEVGSGWEPLCSFLGVDTPSTPFPRENSREDFKAHIAGGDGPTPDHIRQVLDNAREHSKG